ncbi:hypothetical protein PN497_02345 [Sphaerospermopsis kisseleviana CS-549]|uniref:Uncharacterized protein n=1 Tax=Sphaerospermopsis kisseleviana CS-549 TaxID=3021783 RepID=A0ABT4ZLN2_9CYAN|nr:hypothetical protein [Sphaerospermopsis kisseleviana]MDB9440224.1 hypothetical protein [Sphaerospermopsis kisseleviana CS-549]
MTLENSEFNTEIAVGMLSLSLSHLPPHKRSHLSTSPNSELLAAAQRLRPLTSQKKRSLREKD